MKKLMIIFLVTAVAAVAGIAQTPADMESMTPEQKARYEIAMKVAGVRGAQLLSGNLSVLKTNGAPAKAEFDYSLTEYVTMETAAREQYVIYPDSAVKREIRGKELVSVPSDMSVDRLAELNWTFKKVRREFERFFTGYFNNRLSKKYVTFYDSDSSMVPEFIIRIQPLTMSYTAYNLMGSWSVTVVATGLLTVVDQSTGNELAQVGFTESGRFKTAFKGKEQTAVEEAAGWVGQNLAEDFGKLIKKSK